MLLFSAAEPKMATFEIVTLGVDELFCGPTLICPSATSGGPPVAFPDTP